MELKERGAQLQALHGLHRGIHSMELKEIQHVLYESWKVVLGIHSMELKGTSLAFTPTLTSLPESIQWN